MAIITSILPKVLNVFSFFSFLLIFLSFLAVPHNFWNLYRRFPNQKLNSGPVSERV